MSDDKEKSLRVPNGVIFLFGFFAAVLMVFVVVGGGDAPFFWGQQGNVSDHGRKGTRHGDSYESMLKANVGVLRVDAELFYQKTPNQTYSGFCESISVDELFSSKRERARFGCEVDSEGEWYRAHYSFEKGRTFCIDNFGFAGEIKKLGGEAGCV